ncbi:ABC transporter permease [Blastococcus sp. TML/M2B]|uniref:ABC transporter permease n=1 Tax=unclassified Blastococcus TaxID=2619396 RepID=UPI00190B0ABF|nr:MULTISPECIES: ABC transporter permease [unclassified Blastococcus]MBN1091948.1 ABC transporter permease [Blastococcus sp. TML/M2B]MBN1097951.1 ABC transporter permease [Blastococcus sp. TML/C7B]
MTVTATSSTVVLDPRRNVPGTRPGFGSTLRSEWIKFWSVRSTVWSAVMLFVLGAGMTALICATNAEWLASGEADESPGSFITFGMTFAQITAVVLGTLTVTAEYGTGMIRATLAATPKRGSVLAAKALVLTGTLFVLGTVTAVAGYLAGNWFLDREGVGLALTDDGVLRSLVGSGLYLAGLGLLAAAVGLLVRHTAAALSAVLALVFVVGTMAFLLPGAWGEWTAKLLPGNAGSPIAAPVSFNPELMAPLPGFAVFAAEVAALLAVAWVVFSRRDA